ncbi:hypothetical protein HMPREF1862_00767 [Varibaculum cambriense]|uniref:Uncharacterized protein n=1 Tax=Varibaculum cambriense TaxID=184870 RepID=A0AB34X091_9ACTO|nr:hypothetical protein HMPREF1862_00767 [Varibaculum cambriense]
MSQTYALLCARLLDYFLFSFVRTWSKMSDLLRRFSLFPNSLLPFFAFEH